MKTIAGQSQKTEGVQVIARVAQLLRTLEEAPAGLTIGELAEEVGLPRTTVRRLTGALLAEHLLSTTSRGRLRLESGLAGLSLAKRLDAHPELLPFLERLTRIAGETADLSVLDGGEALVIEQVPSPRILRVAADVGLRLPLHCTANGKALLAALPAAEAEALLAVRLLRYTPATVVDHGQLLAEIEAVRESGLACSCEEHLSGVAALATFVPGAKGRPLALAVALPANRLAEEGEEVRAGLLRMREAILARA